MSFARQVAHVFRKDLRRFWPVLIGLGALMVLEVTTGIVSSPRFTQLGMTLQLGIFPIVFAAMTVVVVQEDAVADDRAFWQTLPLSPAAVLLAKLAFVGLFLGLGPAALQVWGIERVAGDGPTTGLLADASLFQLAFLALVCAGASVTRTLRGFLALAVAAWFANTVLRAATAPDPRIFQEGLMQTQAYLFHWGWLLLGGALVAHQYATRRTVRTLAIGVAGYVALAAGVQRLDVDWANRPMEPEERFAYEGADAIEFRVENIQRETGGAIFVARDNHGISAMLSAPSNPGVMLRPTHVRTRVRGGGVDRAFRFDPDRNWSYFLPWGVWGDIPGLEPAPGLSAVRGSFARFEVPIVEVSPEELDGPLSRATHFEARLDVDVFRPRVLGRMPVDSGASLSTPLGNFTVVDLRRSGGSISGAVARQWPARALDVGEGIRREPWTIVLVNRPRAEYLDSWGGTGNNAPRRAVRITGGARTSTQTLQLEFVHRPSRGAEELPEDWFDDVELVVVGTEYVGSFTRTIAREIPEWPGYGPSVRVDPPAPRR